MVELKNIFKTAADYISDRTYRSVYDDKKQDPDLLKVNAPLASYESGPDQPENPDQRGTDGFQDATDGSENA